MGLIREGIGFLHYIWFKLFLVITYAIIFYFFNKYDWGPVIYKVFCYLALFFLIILVYNKKSYKENPKNYLLYECILWIVLIVIFFIFISLTPLKSIIKPSPWDVGYTTHNSLLMLIKEHSDPYNSDKIDIYNSQDPKYRGYHYGPGTLLFYFPSVWFTSAALKFIDLFYLLFLLVIFYLFLYDQKLSKVENYSKFLFSILFLVIPYKFWYELFVQGATDIFPIMLIITSIYFYSKEKYLLAGIFAGISFSSKFSPAIFFLILFLRNKINKHFLIGVLAGLIPLFVFLVYSGWGLINNAFIFHIIKLPLKLSLYSITPKQFHFVFNLIKILAVMFFIYKNFNRPFEKNLLLVDFTLLIIIIEITFTEIHGNHLIWFIPLFALIFSIYKNRFYQTKN